MASDSHLYSLMHSLPPEASLSVAAVLRRLHLLKALNGILLKAYLPCDDRAARHSLSRALRRDKRVSALYCLSLVAVPGSPNFLKPKISVTLAVPIYLRRPVSRRIFAERCFCSSIYKSLLT